MPDLTVIVLAAGGGTRMKSKTAKVLHPVAGRSMVGHVLNAVAAVRPTRVVAVVGHQREAVSAHIAQLMPEVVLAVQETQDGTAHAVSTAMRAAGETTGTVLVTYADTPLLEGANLRAFAEDHTASGRAMSILSGELADPTGYGRIVRGADGSVESIVEEKDATPAQRALREINSGIVAFDAGFLADALPRIGNDNAKREYYLTDTVALARAAGERVDAFRLDDVSQTLGANDRAQLAALGRVLNDRIVSRWMAEGVTVMDPATTWVEADVSLAPDVTLLPGVQLLGACAIAEDAVIGPDCTLEDTEVGAGARVVRTHGQLAVVGAGASVGPWSYLRPGARLEEGAKAGAFVEVKNSTIGAGAKVPHLSYVGDADIGEGTNIGAGAIFANYDGVVKNRSVIGRQVKTGVHNSFVAPVHVGDGAVTGAGTVVRRDVPPGALAVSGGPQRHVEGWVFRKRAGTPAAEAAAAAAPTPDPGGPDAAEGGESS
ncbi:bifunctional protein GlmU [Marmoricola endophyticus]|uniref:Bifunctional protein GlmU n=1 Tax=Marmoricola endophyticus TaxID=2040280 RepID=A0A917F6J5_9ACTN|nr:bifunctional UDP-N-acetylglucosamine diphosphorylase/glucosamine-1-phosphate N-acetyltransferase GlmU [Marmoricola endophyticus]GGF52631.1 bifunctional protein GlmU [Marmoricola endophyticus]